MNNPTATDRSGTASRRSPLTREHGRVGAREWARVLHIGEHDTLRFWSAIVQAVLDVPVSTIRDVSPYGANCEVPVTLTLGGRAAATITVWHYNGAGEAPRLVTAYPRL